MSLLDNLQAELRECRELSSKALDKAWAEAARLRADLARLTAENERLENLTASGIHTCHADCQRPMCVMRRERDKAQSDLARVTAERDRYHDALIARHGGEPIALLAELDTERARVAELVEQLKAYGKYAHDTTLEDQNAELVAALADIRDMPEYDQDDAHRLRDKAKQALARSESATPEVVQESLTTEPATPAKHPDTELLEWLFGNTIIAGPYGHVIDCRDDADAARKQGGTP